jgi:hypothetical protein
MIESAAYTQPIREIKARTMPRKKPPKADIVRATTETSASNSRQIRVKIFIAIPYLVCIHYNRIKKECNPLLRIKKHKEQGG